MIADWPTGYDIERYTEEHGLAFDDITRDIVRIATIAHLLDTGVLDDDFVLTGGMALRLRGLTVSRSRTPTARCADVSMSWSSAASCDSRPTSYRSTPTRVPTGVAKRPSSSTSSRSTTRPTSRRSPATQSKASSPSQSVNVGLFEPAEWLALRHPYPELVIEPNDLTVPVMDIVEQAAEKVVGWAAGSLIKHYLDLAWIGREFGESLIAEDFQRLVQRKLDIGFTTFPGVYRDLREIKDLLIPLHRPRAWQGPLNRAGDNGASLIRFMGPN